jgi:hypothetical protein
MLRGCLHVLQRVIDEDDSVVSSLKAQPTLRSRVKGRVVLQGTEGTGERDTFQWKDGPKVQFEKTGASRLLICGQNDRDSRCGPRIDRIENLVVDLEVSFEPTAEQRLDVDFPAKLEQCALQRWLNPRTSHDDIRPRALKEDLVQQGWVYPVPLTKRSLPPSLSCTLGVKQHAVHIERKNGVVRSLHHTRPITTLDGLDSAQSEVVEIDAALICRADAADYEVRALGHGQGDRLGPP